MSISWSLKLFSWEFSHACSFLHKLSMISKDSFIHVFISLTFWEFVMFSIKLPNLIMFWSEWVQESSCMLGSWTFIKFKLKFYTIGMSLGHDFLKWSLKHVLWVSMSFLKFWPQNVEFWSIWFEFEALRSNLKILEFASTLERRSSHSSEHSECVHFRSSDWKLARAWNACIYKFICFAARSSDISHARARVWVLSSSVDRASIERPLSVKRKQPLLFPKFTVRSSEKSHARA